MYVDTRCALESLICLRERPSVVDRIYLRETRRRNADGTEVAHLALAHNERDPITGMPKTKIVHNFGRADLVDREGLRRLVGSISRFLDPADAVAATGLALVGLLSEKVGLEELCDDRISLVPFPGRRAATLVHSLVIRGNCIDDADVLRAGSTAAVLSHRVMAPPTLGTFLRSFTFGHVRQLDAVAETLMARAWSLGAGPGDAPLTIDIDSTICEVHGNLKHGASYGYTHVLGYHPVLATRADTGEVLHLRFRKGSANTQRGAQRFVRETVGRVRRAGASGPLTLRTDSRAPDIVTEFMQCRERP